MVVQPSTLAARNEPFNRQPVVQVSDELGQPVSEAGIEVTAEKASGPGTGNLGGDRTVTTSESGQAVFTDLKFNRAGTYTIRFRANGLQSVTSSLIIIP
jgi:hypothetical protein